MTCCVCVLGELWFIDGHSLPYNTLVSFFYLVCFVMRIRYAGVTDGGGSDSLLHKYVAID